MRIDPGRAARAAIAISDGSTTIDTAGEPGVYSVASFSGEDRYTVRLGDRPSCTCPDSEFNGATCKHLLAAALAAGLNVRFGGSP